MATIHARDSASDSAWQMSRSAFVIGPSELDARGDRSGACWSSELECWCCWTASGPANVISNAAFVESGLQVAPRSAYVDFGITSCGQPSDASHLSAIGLSKQCRHDSGRRPTHPFVFVNL